MKEKNKAKRTLPGLNSFRSSSEDTSGAYAAASNRPIRRTYDLPQPPSPVVLREYILTSLQGDRCCLLHWLLQEDIAIDRMLFDLTQLNENGEEIETIEVTLSEDELPAMTPGEMFAPQWAIPVSPRCVAIRAVLRELSSGPYLYRIAVTGASVEYTASTAWVYDKKVAKKDKMKRRETFRVESKLGSRVRGIWPIAFLSLVVVAVVVSFAYFKYLINWDLVRRALTKFFSDLPNLLRGGKQPAASIAAILRAFGTL